MFEIEVSWEEITEMLEKLEKGKAIVPDGVSRHILKECWQQLSATVYDVIRCSLTTGRVPKE